MKPKSAKRPPNPAARSLREGKFQQRIVKAKKSGYSRKEKHKKREVPDNELPSFLLAEPASFGAPVKSIPKF